MSHNLHSPITFQILRIFNEIQGTDPGRIDLSVMKPLSTVIHIIAALYSTRVQILYDQRHPIQYIVLILIPICNLGEHSSGHAVLKR